MFSGLFKYGFIGTSLICVGLLIGLLYYRGNAAHLQDKYDKAVAQIQVLSTTVATQNQSIQIAAEAKASQDQRLTVAETKNSKLEMTLQKTLHQINTDKIGPTCTNAMDYLRQQAPSLSH